MADASDSAVKRVRTRHFQRAKEQGIRITGLTSYDMNTARIFDEPGSTSCSSATPREQWFGYDTTLPVTLDELIPLTRAVASAAQRALVVADMPFGSYESGPDHALETAFRFMKETGAHAVKLEGGVRSAEQIRRIVSAGIPVMAHIGFTPQSEHGLGGHVIQGRGEQAERLLADAHAVEQAGAFAVVLEMVPSAVAARVTSELGIPTISVGAGPHCDGQLLVWTDWAGPLEGPRAEVRPAVRRPRRRAALSGARLQVGRRVGGLPRPRARVHRLVGGFLGGPLARPLGDDLGGAGGFFACREGTDAVDRERLRAIIHPRRSARCTSTPARFRSAPILAPP